MIIKTNVKTIGNNVKELNEEFRLFNKINSINITFKLRDCNSVNEIYGNFDPINSNIEIELNDTFNRILLESTINHEIIHFIQNQKSKFKYSKWIINYGNTINKKVLEFNTQKDKSLSKYNEIRFMKYNYNLGNKYEQMAYACQFVEMSYTLNIYNLEDLIKYIRNNTNILIHKTFKKYLYLYWVNKGK